MAENDMLLFGTNIPGTYRLSELYKYRISPDGSTVDQTQTGTVVPAKDSVIVDDTLGDGNVRFFSVVSVDNTGDDPTYEAYLQEVSNNIQKTHHMDNSGNSLLLLYYEYPGYVQDSKDYYRLVVDRKLNLGSSSSSHYYILTDQEGTEISIDRENGSLRLGDSDMARVDMEEDVDGSNRWVFPDCGADPDQITIANGDILILHVYDSKDTEVTAFNLYCREIKAVGDLNAASSVLTDITLLEDGSEVTGNITVKENTDPNNLVADDHLYIRLHYGDGTTLDKSIRDNDECFVYGLDDVQTGYEQDGSFVGQTYQILAKYYIPVDQVTPSDTPAITSERYMSENAVVEVVSA